MENQQPKSNVPYLIFSVIKWLITVFLIICALAALLIDTAIASAMLFLIAAFLVMPSLKGFRSNKVAFLENRWVKGGLLTLLFFLAFGLIPKRKDQKLASKNHVEEKADNFAEIAPDVITTYIERNKSKMIFQNMDTLIYYQSIFSDDYVTAWDLQSDQLQMDQLNHTATYKPFIQNHLAAKYFLSPINRNDTLNDYQIKFYFVGDTVSKAEAVAKLGSKISILAESDKTDFSKLLLRDVILMQMTLIQAKRDAAAYVKNSAENKSKFEQSCLSSYDGSCPALVEYVKKHMNDPESFDHAETSYKVKADYAIVRMSYRGKNAFGAKVLGIVEAKVNFSCEVIQIAQVQ